MRKKRRIAWMNVGLRSIINVIKWGLAGSHPLSGQTEPHPACGFFHSLVDIPSVVCYTEIIYLGKL